MTHSSTYNLMIQVRVINSRTPIICTCNEILYHFCANWGKQYINDRELAIVLQTSGPTLVSFTLVPYFIIMSFCIQQFWFLLRSCKTLLSSGHISLQVGQLNVSFIFILLLVIQATEARDGIQTESWKYFNHKKSKVLYGSCNGARPDDKICIKKWKAPPLLQ